MKRSTTRPKAANVTPADLVAAANLKAIWLAHPNRPTQQALADAWDGNREANQSLISQYMNGKIPLNFHAVTFFAKQLGCRPEEIRWDLPEQRRDWTDSERETAAQRLIESQPAGLDVEILTSAIELAGHVFDFLKDELGGTVSDHPKIIASAYIALDNSRRSSTPATMLDLTKKLVAKIKAEETSNGDQRKRNEKAGRAGGGVRGGTTRT